MLQTSAVDIKLEQAVFVSAGEQVIAVTGDQADSCTGKLRRPDLCLRARRRAAIQTLIAHRQQQVAVQCTDTLNHRLCRQTADGHVLAIAAAFINAQYAFAAQRVHRIGAHQLHKAALGVAELFLIGIAAA